MPTASAITVDLATKSGGTLCSDGAASVQLSSALAEKAKELFDKPYRALVDFFSVPGQRPYAERDAHYRLSGSRKFTALEIARLLQSEEGIHFLAVLMERKRPEWWKAILKMGALGTVEQRRQADMKLMRRVFDADRTAAAEFSTSFRAQDPDFFGAVLAGYDELSALGAEDSPVAKGRRR